MEVHHHPHVGSDSHRKTNFKEYFFEFIMIFLAVTMGFFAEGIHEHFNIKEIEKRNIEGLLRNLDEDSVNLTEAIGNNLLTRYMFIFDQSAFDQTQSSGTLRLINNHDVTATIIQYNRKNKIIRELDASIDQWFSRSIQSLARFTDLKARLKEEPMKMNKMLM